MRWKINKEKHEMGETRIQEHFLFFPLTLHGERRWLERAKWEEQVCSIGTSGDSQKIKYGWTCNRWLD